MVWCFISGTIPQAACARISTLLETRFPCSEFKFSRKINKQTTNNKLKQLEITDLMTLYLNAQMQKSHKSVKANVLHSQACGSRPFSCTTPPTNIRKKTTQSNKQKYHTHHAMLVLHTAKARATDHPSSAISCSSKISIWMQAPRRSTDGIPPSKSVTLEKKCHLVRRKYWFWCVVVVRGGGAAIARIR